MTVIPDDLQKLILGAAFEQKLDPALLGALIWSESNFVRTAKSPAGAEGYGQLMPGTAAGLGVTDPFDAHQNVYATAKYLRDQLDAHGGDTRLALASYNAGPGAVAKYGGVPPYPETQAYVERVLARTRQLPGLHAAEAPGEQLTKPTTQPKASKAADAVTALQRDAAAKSKAETVAAAVEATKPDPAVDALARLTSSVGEQAAGVSENPLQALGESTAKLAHIAPPSYAPIRIPSATPATVAPSAATAGAAPPRAATPAAPEAPAEVAGPPAGARGGSAVPAVAKVVPPKQQMRILVAIAKARELGLSARENPAGDDHNVDPVHVKNSYHYRRYPGHPNIGEAVDVSGNPQAMASFYRWMKQTYDGKGLTELFYDPLGGIKNDQEIGAIGGHSDHVHAAFGAP